MWAALALSAGHSSGLAGRGTGDLRRVNENKSVSR